MTPDVVQRIDEAIAVRPEVADLLGACRAEIEQLRSQVAAAPVVDVTAPDLVQRWKGALADARIGWIVDGDDEVWPPFGAHGGGRYPSHHYDGRCAICRCGDSAPALSALLAFLADAALRPSDGA